MVRGIRRTSPKTSPKTELVVVSRVRMKRKAPSVSFSQRRYQNPLILSFSATPSLLSIRSSQAQEPTSPTRMGARMPIALQRGRGAETVASCTIRSSLTTQEEDDESVRSQMGPTSSRS
ncbi:zeaxanthin epoxidase [Pyrus ussuriensis x Pyrus communis]|uniref:Zeaxanthin epoxidase n=1 Tax=Pyrus ussuriensis x Pyrus communis TaxID=2448454 RepID=A0A5N5F7I0_9ROSA|nr:zeaxanthin epoxidase [Pyrus ussuriensis x Pyrus communis]